MKISEMRVVFMGTPAFAVPSLEGLYGIGCNVVAVVSQPDRPKGRGRQLQPTPIAAVARRKGTRLFQWARLNNESYEQITALKPDLIVVVAYGKILPKRYLEIPRLGCLNVHASLLPRLRGAAPIQWSVIGGDSVTGVSIMRLDEGMDTGDVAEMVSTPIGSDETAGQLHDRLSLLGVEPLCAVIRRLSDGTVEFKPQDHANMSHAPMLTKAHGVLNWAQSSQTLHNHVRGMSPWPGAFIPLKEGPLKVHAVRTDVREGDAGMVIAHTSDGPVVACGQGSIVLLRLQRPGRKAVSGGDFIRGGGALIGQHIGEC